MAEFEQSLQQKKLQVEEALSRKQAKQIDLLHKGQLGFEQQKLLGFVAAEMDLIQKHSQVMVQGIQNAYKKGKSTLRDYQASEKQLLLQHFEQLLQKSDEHLAAENKLLQVLNCEHCNNSRTIMINWCNFTLEMWKKRISNQLKLNAVL